MKDETLPHSSFGEVQPSRSAEHFLDHEKAYQLGGLPTEQPHPKTANLSEILRSDTTAGVRTLQSVDEDLVPVLAQTLASPSFKALVTAMTDALLAGRRVFFTGCGATGRLAILLEASWRRFWDQVDHKPTAKVRGDQVRSVMAGGDFALIRSVEGFEDFTDFGRHQLRQSGVEPGDVVVAITEGGETSFVIGTAWEAVEVEADSFFVFNNPSDVLASMVQRSREVIQDPRITALDLSTGPMAVAGSTRMQATTIELLVVGIALEHALSSVVQNDGIDLKHTPPPVPLNQASDLFSGLLEQLSGPENLDALARLVEAEAEVYKKKGLVTYFADHYLLDVLTDTTERSPTFSLPPFREVGDEGSAQSWSFVKDPLLNTPEAWHTMLGRDPLGLDWDSETYAEMGAPDQLRLDPPQLNQERILRFAIGNEPDASRAAPGSLAISLLVGHEAEEHLNPDSAFHRGVMEHGNSYDEQALLVIGPPRKNTDEADGYDRIFSITCPLPDSPLDIWSHVAAKLILNTVSTASMGLIGRLTGNWMVYVNTSNKKLIDRGVRLIADQSDVSYAEACHALFETLSQTDASIMVGRHAHSPVATTIQRLDKEHH